MMNDTNTARASGRKTSDTIVGKERPARILLVEDNRGDVLLTRRAFQEARIANELTVAETGEEALEMLARKGQWGKLDKPDLILLDLNLPQMNGQEVLANIKQQAGLRHIPVIILSSSHATQDVVKSYNLHASGYVVKPLSLDNFNEVVRKLEHFWFTLVILPDEEDVKQAL